MMMKMIINNHTVIIAITKSTRRGWETYDFVHYSTVKVRMYAIIIIICAALLISHH